jgi:hypothetical protein
MGQEKCAWLSVMIPIEFDRAAGNPADAVPAARGDARHPWHCRLLTAAQCIDI